MERRIELTSFPSFPSFLSFPSVLSFFLSFPSSSSSQVRACIEMGAGNPIVSIHDQGAGGNGNVLKEISEPMGALLEVRDILVADPSMSVLEIWGAEYQENNALLLRPESLEAFRALCEREKSPFSVVGKVREEPGGRGGRGRERWRGKMEGENIL